MKITITKKELKGYMEIVETTVGAMVDEPTMVLMKMQFTQQIKAGIKEGAVKIGLNKKMNLVYEIDQEFVCKLLSLYSKYLAVVIPQIMSIVNLTKNLIEDTEELAYSFEEDENEDPEKEEKCNCGFCGKEE